MIISKKKLDRLMQEHTAKALEEAHRRDALERELMNIREFLYRGNDELRSYMHRLEARIDKLEGQGIPIEPCSER